LSENSKGNFVKFGSELKWGWETTRFLPVTCHISETVQDAIIVISRLIT